VYTRAMELEKIHQDYRELILADNEKAERIIQLELANMELTAALTDRGEELNIYKELAHGVLFKSVDKYLQTVSTNYETSR